LIFIFESCKIIFGEYIVSLWCNGGAFMRRILLLIIIISVLLCGCDKKTEAFVALPILMYHHIAEVGDDTATVSRAVFEAQMSELKSRGFSAVAFSDVMNYVYFGEPLPHKPMLIVFDDGYLSNLEHAFPVLEKFGFKAGISVIGHSVGKTANSGMLSHFSWEQARMMQESGLVEFASHTFDLHTDEIKSQVDLITDHEKMCNLFSAELSSEPSVFAYPHGVWDCDSENLLRRLGIRMTLISDAGMNILVPGDGNCLYLLRRYNICETVDFSSLLDKFERYL